MASSVTLIALFSLSLFAGILFIEARNYPGDYRKGVTENDEAAIHEVLVMTKQLVQIENALSNLKKMRITSTSTPGAYDHDEHSYSTSEKKSFVKDFEPRPNVSAYGDDTKLNKEHDKDFEPRPNVSSYGDDSKLMDKEHDKDFEPRLSSLTAYGDDSKLKKEHKSFMKDFESRPSVTHEPRVNPCANGDGIGLKRTLLA